MFQTNDVYNTNRQSTVVWRRKRRRQRIRKIKKIILCIGTVFCICGGIIFLGKCKLNEKWSETEAGEALAEEFLEKQRNNPNGVYPQELQEMLERNPEVYDFVTGYPERDSYQGKAIDLSGEVKPGQVPLFLQWDKRWGYDSYGSEMIAVAGCGPTCMSMAYVYLTENMDKNPREMAAFAHDNGYDTEAGTSWSFFTDGAEQLGLKGAEIGLDERKMKEVLDEGKVIICSMRPGDFTTTGHIILIRGYEEEGFLVNDPNSKENSKKHWEYDTLSSQIKCLWSVGR